MNRFSRAREYSKPVSPFDMNFIGQAMAYKQSRVDANKALIQDTIDNIMGMTIDKPEAREYLYGRVEQLVNNVNAYRNTDLSNDSVARNISSYINNAMDETVLNAYAGTMEGRKMEQYYDKLMLEDPERYNERNKAFAMAPYYRWLQDGKAGSRLAPLQVSNYVDYSKQAQDVLKQMREAQKGGMEWRYQDPDNPGYFITKNIDKMTADEVQQAVYNSMSPEARKQIYIDGWYMANTQPQAFTPEALNQYVSGINRDYDRDKAALRAQMAGAVGDKQRYEELRRSYDILDDRRTSFNNKARQIFSSGNIEDMGAFMVENNFLRGMGQTWAYDKSSTKMENDPSYWNKKRLEWDMSKAQIDAVYRKEDLNIRRERLGFEREELDFKREQLALDTEYKRSQIDLNRAKAMKTLSGVSDGNEGAGVGNYAGVGVSVNTVMDASGDLLPADKRVAAELKTYTDDRDKNVMNLTNALTPEAKSDVNAWISKAREESPGQYASLSDQEMVIKYFDENGGFANEYLQRNNALSYLQNAKRATRYLDAPLKIANEYQDYQAAMISDNKDRAAEIIANSDDIVVVGYDGEIVPVSKAAYLSGGELLANALAEDFIINSSSIETNLGLFSSKPLFLNRLDVDKVNSPSMVSYFKQISRLVGEDVSIDDIFVPDETGRYYEISDSDSYVAKLMRGVSAMRAAGRKRPVGSQGIPRLPLNIAGVREIASLINNPSEFDSLSNKYINTLVTPLGQAVSEKAPAESAEREFYIDLHTLYSNIADPGAVEKMEKNPNKTAALASVVDPNTGSVAYGIYMNGDQRNMVAVDAATLKRSGIDIEATRKTPVDKMTPAYNSVKLAASTNDIYAEYISGLTGATGFASKTEIQNSLLDEYPNLLSISTPQGLAATDFGREAINLVENIEKIGVGIEGYANGSSRGVRVSLYDNSKDESSRVPVYTFNIPGIEWGDTAQDWLDACPQYFVLQGLRNTLDEYRIGVGRGNLSAKSAWDSIYRITTKGNGNGRQQQ